MHSPTPDTPLPFAVKLEFIGGGWNRTRFATRGLAEQYHAKWRFAPGVIACVLETPSDKPEASPNLETVDALKARVEALVKENKQLAADYFAMRSTQRELLEAVEYWKGLHNSLIADLKEELAKRG